MASVVFLDVRMPELDGFQTLDALGDDTPRIVFVTAYAEHAVRAFEVHALDYLLKPVDGDRLSETMARIRDQLHDKAPTDQREHVADLIKAVRREQAQIQDAIAHVQGRYPERLLLKDGADASFVRTREIAWIEAAGNYVRIHAIDGAHLVRRTISELEHTLDPDRFVRIHRSTIVNLDCVDRLSPAFAGAYFVHLKNGKEK